MIDLTRSETIHKAVLLSSGHEGGESTSTQNRTFIIGFMLFSFLVSPMMLKAIRL